MKKIKAIAFFLLSLFLITEVTQAYVQITWHYGHKEKRNWEPTGQNDWGGLDEWCVGERDKVCSLWDWRTTYHHLRTSQLEPVQTDPSYPVEPMGRASEEMQIPIPSDLGTPTVEIYERPE